MINLDTIKRTHKTNTPEGGRKAAATNKAKYGEDFYKIIGQKGGRTSRNGGYATAAGRVLASQVGALGGSRGKNGYKLLSLEGDFGHYRHTATGNLRTYDFTNKVWTDA